MMAVCDNCAIEENNTTPKGDHPVNQNAMHQDTGEKDVGAVCGKAHRNHPKQYLIIAMSEGCSRCHMAISYG